MLISMLAFLQNDSDTLTNAIGWIVVGGVAGWLAGQVVKGRGLGVIGNIVVGIVGAVLGGWLLGVLGFNSAGGLVPTLISAFVGAVVLLVLLGIPRKRD
ncbi:MAG TPA: GlsB/YeaQ/YmgE family stress response membrane protein [Planctomycetota bacterium]|nr:GlsB/YeaQ/YmgE family stress response membrane protein [Planctomycetota bacterium]